MPVTRASSKSDLFELSHEKGERSAGREIEVKLSYLIEKAQTGAMVTMSVWVHLNSLDIQIVLWSTLHLLSFSRVMNLSILNRKRESVLVQ